MPIASSSDPASVVAFFLPGVDAHLRDREYSRLQACAQRSTGFKPLESRIQRLACRIGGRDCDVEVGQPDPSGDAMVVAIIDLGRHLSYGVFTTADPDAPAFLVGKRIYSVTEFG